MKKIIITLSITILVFVLTLLFTNQYISDKAMESSDALVMQKIDNISSDFDDDLLMTKNAVYSFLAGNLIKNTKRDPDCFYVDDNRLKYFVDDVKEDFESFLTANPYYENVVMIIEKDKAAPLSQKSYYAPILRQGEEGIHDLAEYYDLSKSINLKKVKNTLKSFWALPSDASGKLHKLLYFFVPICRNSDGNYLGAFCLSMNISTLDKKIEKNLPYGKEESEMIIISDDSTIIASYPNSYENFKSYINLKEKIEEQVPVSVEDTSERKIINYNGTEYFQYERELKNAPWKIIAGCTSKAVYEGANTIKHMVLTTSLIGMLLMLISCVVIMLQIYNANRKKIAAEDELNMASNVQMSLLRKRDYEGNGNSLHAYIKPAREAGGDLYDYVEVDGKLVFCIGDVSGKGMPAALFMTQVISLFRSAVKHSVDPSFILSSINEVMSDNNPDMTFCTLFVATLDGTNLTFSNAGHNKPLLLSSAPSFLQTTSNIAVGIMAKYPYKSETYTMQQGDTLLLYTDGVTEAKNKSHKLYGEQRMIDVLSSRTDNAPLPCTDLLLSSVNSFVNGAEQSDDITILTIQCKKS